MRLFFRVALLTLLLLCGCAPSEEQQRLDDTFALATHRLREVSHDLMASASYQSAIETGANPVDYIVISMPENTQFSQLVWQGPIAPWTVVVKDGPGQTELVVEAYGEAIDKPTRTETIDLAMKPRQEPGTQ